MASPVKPSEFCSLAPSAGTDPCTALKRIFFEIPALLCEFWSWMFDSEGEISDAFKAEMRELPSGLICDFGGTTAPDGWLMCQGQAVSRTTYSDLFATIGTIFGVGDGSTTFNLPDSREKVAVGWNPASGTYYPGATGGAATHTMDVDELPEHDHFVGVEGTGEVVDYTGDEFDAPGGDFERGAHNIHITRAGRTSETGSSTPFSLLQPYFVCTKIIKT